MWSIWFLLDAGILDSSIGIVGTCLDVLIESSWGSWKIDTDSNPSHVCAASFGRLSSVFIQGKVDFEIQKLPVRTEVLQRTGGTWWDHPSGFFERRHHIPLDPLEVLMVTSLLESQWVCQLVSISFETGAWCIWCVVFSKKLSQPQQTHPPKKETFNLKLCLFLWNIST